jgi:integrase
MPREASDKPWLHSATDWWCATVLGKRVYLDKDYQVACRKLKQIRARVKREGTMAKDWLSVPFCVLADEFQEDVKARRKPGTYTAYRYDLLRALKILGKKLRVGDIRKFHLAKVEQVLIKAGYSPTTIRSTITTVQGVLGWGVRQQYLESNWLAGYEKPSPVERTRVVTPAEFRALMRHADRNFQCFLMALRLTGCRPAEVSNLIWAWVDLEQGFWVIPDHKTLTRTKKRRPRVIPLSGSLLRLCRWLARVPHQAGDHVFLNRLGRPYSKDCLVRKFDRLRTRAGIREIGGERLVLYSHRHAFASERVGRVTDLELAELTGHTEVRMLRRYVHVNRNRLLDIQRRAARRG